MPKQPKEKSAHLQELEAVFERHTRRFSPFDVLGLRSGEQDTADPHPRATEEDNLSTHGGVDGTHPHDLSTHRGESATPLPEEGIHTRVVEFTDLSLTSTEQNTSTHGGVGGTHPHDLSTHRGESATPLPE